MSAALLSRFDLVFILLDKPDEMLDKRVSDHIIAVSSCQPCFLFMSHECIVKTSGSSSNSMNQYFLRTISLAGHISNWIAMTQISYKQLHSNDRDHSASNKRIKTGYYYILSVVPLSVLQLKCKGAFLFCTCTQCHHVMLIWDLELVEIHLLQGWGYTQRKTKILLHWLDNFFASIYLLQENMFTQGI